MTTLTAPPAPDTKAWWEDDDGWSTLYRTWLADIQRWAITQKNNGSTRTLLVPR